MSLTDFWRKPKIILVSINIKQWNSQYVPHSAVAIARSGKLIQSKIPCLLHSLHANPVILLVANSAKHCSIGVLVSEPGIVFSWFDRTIKAWIGHWSISQPLGARIADFKGFLFVLITKNFVKETVPAIVFPVIGSLSLDSFFFAAMLEMLWSVK